MALCLPRFGVFLCAQIIGEIMEDINVVDGYSVPVDPMDLLQCDSCQ